jgi:putative spermidine/putrescine transport system permease protein
LFCNDIGVFLKQDDSTNLKKIKFLLLALLFSVPFIYLVLLSWAANWRFPLLLPENWSAATWHYFLETDQSVGKSLGLSVFISSLVGFFSSGLGFFISKNIAYHRHKNIFLNIAYFPYAFSPVVYAFCLNFFFIKMNLIGTIQGVVLAQFLISFPFAVILLMNHWTPTLRQLEETVLTLGGSTFQAFREVILPLSKPILWVCFFQTFLICWFEYGLTSIIGLGQVQTLTVKTYQFIGESNVYFAAMSSVLLVFPALILLLGIREIKS